MASLIYTRYLVCALLIGALSGCSDSRSGSQSSTKLAESTNKQRSREIILRQELSYLNDIEEVAWYEVDDNDVIVGFEPLPEDWELVIRGAALRGNRAIDFGCHVWAVKAKDRGWRPGTGPYYGEVTARQGKIE
jgi:hypothetical protein